ncbi:MAG: ABC transporter permease [Chloroflexota bacterium]
MASPAIEKQIPVDINEPTRNRLLDELKSTWAYRELLGFLVWRDVKVRYKQTVLGVSWAILQPLLTMVVFTIFFGNFAQIPSDDLPYPIFNFAALVPWTYFTAALNSASTSLVASSNMLKKIYFPRMVLPLSGVITGLVDMSLSFSMLILLCFAFGVSIAPTFIFLPLFVLMAMLTALGFGMWLSVLNVQFRDVRFAMPFIINLWLFITPVIYPTSIIDEQWRWLLSLNPMVSVIEGFRWALLGSGNAPDGTIFISLGVILFLVVTGTIYFNRSEGFFADVV